LEELRKITNNLS